MRLVLIIGLVTALIGCKEKAELVAGLPELHVPSQDSLDSIYQVDIVELRKVAGGSARGGDAYYHGDTLFTGWAGYDDPSNNHRYRYARYVEGELVRQIGYYANGQLDHDFYIQHGKSIGHERMWMADGNPYILFFYSAPGVMHGIQRRWHSHNRLAWQGEYVHGTELYSAHFDREGNITDFSGDLPEALQNQVRH